MGRRQKKTHFFLDYVRCAQWVGPAHKDKPIPDAKPPESQPTAQNSNSNRKPQATQDKSVNQNSGLPSSPLERGITANTETKDSFVQQKLNSSISLNSQSNSFSALRILASSESKLFSKIASVLYSQMVHASQPPQSGVTNQRNIPQQTFTTPLPFSPSGQMSENVDSSSISKNLGAILNISSAENIPTSSAVMSKMIASVSSLVILLQTVSPSIAAENLPIQSLLQSLSPHFQNELTFAFPNLSLPPSSLKGSETLKGTPQSPVIQQTLQTLLASLFSGSMIQVYSYPPMWGFMKGLVQFINYQFLNMGTHSPLLDELSALMGASRRRLSKESKKRISAFDRVNRKDSFLAEADSQEKEEEPEALVDLLPKCDSNDSSTSFYWY